MSEPVRNIAVNRKARREYELYERFEAGLSLLGSEVKSLRGGRVNIKEAYVRLKGGSAWLIGCHISPYQQANRNNHDPIRERRLLLHRRELLRLRKGVAEKGMTIVPLRLLLRGSLFKLEIALAKGKKLYDKRQDMKARAARREMDRRR